MRVVFWLLAGPLLLLLGLGHNLAEHPLPAAAPASPLATQAPPAPAPVTVTGAAGKPPVAPVPTAAPDAGLSSDLAAMVQYARSWLEPPVPYLWGGCSRHGIDCSCFVQTVYAQFGIHVSRTTVTQVAEEIAIPRDQIRVGDSVFFDNTCVNCGPNPTHVGLYIGGGLMINAGDPVQIEPVFWNKLHSIGRPRGL